MSNVNSISPSGVNEVPSHEAINQFLRLDGLTGKLFWKARSGARSVIGAQAGSLNGDGYLQVSLHGTRYMVHRLVWTMTNGSKPNGQIDHINGDRLDNRPENLRDVCQSTNLQNRRADGGSGVSGLLGVSRVNRLGKWSAYIKPPGEKRIYLGMFKTAEEAHQAYLVAKRQHHSGCTI